MTITLPWPPSGLSPNARIHHMAHYKAKKAYRQACAFQAIAQGLKPINADRLHVHLEFFKPTRRAMDLDNTLARMKSGLDALADVLKVDDSKWTLSIAFAQEVGGMVKVTITEPA